MRGPSERVRFERGPLEEGTRTTTGKGGTYTIIYMGLGSTCSRARPEPAPIARYKEQIERSGNRSLDSGKTNVNY